MHSITLAVPVYNSAKFLPNLFQSIECLTVFPDQIIFRDDCSTDDSVELIKDYMRLSSHIKMNLIRNEVNQGIAKNYNLLVNDTETDWIHIMDGDDAFAGDYYKYIVPCLNKNISYVLTGFTCNSRLVSAYQYLGYLLPDRMLAYMPMLGSFSVRSSVTYRTKLLRENPFNEPQFDGSDIVHIHALKECFDCRSRFIRYPLVFYRIHSQAASAFVDSTIYLRFVKSLKGVEHFFYYLDYFLRKKVGLLIRRSL